METDLTQILIHAVFTVYSLNILYYGLLNSDIKYWQTLLELRRIMTTKQTFIHSLYWLAQNYGFYFCTWLVGNSLHTFISGQQVPSHWSFIYNGIKLGGIQLDGLWLCHYLMKERMAGQWHSCQGRPVWRGSLLLTKIKFYSIMEK